MMAALIAEPQPCPVFMCCRRLDVGAHHACWLLLQALFITASVPTVTSTTACQKRTHALQQNCVLINSEAELAIRNHGSTVRVRRDLLIISSNAFFPA